MTAPDPARVHALPARAAGAHLRRARGGGRRRALPRRSASRRRRRARAAARARGRRGHREGGGELHARARHARCPPPATARRPELAGAPFEAVSLSLIVHPRNPYVAHLAHEPALLHGDARGRAPRLVVRRRLRPDAVLRLRRGLRALAPHRARRLRAARPRRLRALQEGVRRVLLPAAPRRAARHRRHCSSTTSPSAASRRVLRLRAQRGRAFLAGLPPDRGAPQAHAVRRARARLPALPARALRRVQPASTTAARSTASQSGRRIE